MKVILLAALLVAALCGGSQYSRRVNLQRGVRNSVSFACANEDSQGSWNVVVQPYKYTCTGFPSWCNWDGKTLSGTVPAGWKGNFRVDVDYDGPTRGRKSYYFSCDDNSDDSNWGWSRWWNKGPGSYVVACPEIPHTVRPPTDPIPPPVSPGNGNGHGNWNGNGNDNGHGNGDSNGHGNGGNGNWNGNGNENGNGNGDNSGNGKGNSNGNGNGGSGHGSGSNWSCGKSNWRGSGVIVSVGSDSCTLDNGRVIRFANCSSRRYKQGRKNFAVSDKINFDCWDDGKIIWVNSAVCV